MANGYYYLIASLPELSLTDKSLPFDVVGYRDYIQQDLDPKDARLIKTLYYSYDISNLAALVKNPAAIWNKAGNYSKDSFEAMLRAPETLPDFLPAFYEDTHTRWERWNEKQFFNHAMSAYLDWAASTPNRFLQQWIHFSVTLKNLLIHLNCQKFDLSAMEAVLGKFAEAEYLRETASEHVDVRWWDFPAKEVEVLFHNPNIAQREFLIEEFRWKHLDTLEEDYSFGIERLLAYAIRLRILHRNLNTEEAGRQRLQELMHDITHEYSMPETFN